MRGKPDYKRYSSVDKLMIRLIMLMTGGPLRSGKGISYTHWNEVDEFTEKRPVMIKPIPY